LWVIIVLCAGSMLPLAKQSLDEAPYKLSGAVAKLAGITFWSLAFSWIRHTLVSYWGKTRCCTHQTFLLGFPTGRWSTLSHTATAHLCPVQLEQHLLALVLLLPSNVQYVVWATHQWWACSFSHSQPLAWEFYELLFLTSSLWPQGILMSLLWENCEWNRVEEGVFLVLGFHWGADTSLHAFGD
jgi:hypothetical protein